MKNLILIATLVAMVSCGPAQVHDAPRESGGIFHPAPPAPPTNSPPKCSNCGIDQANPSPKDYGRSVP